MRSTLARLFLLVTPSLLINSVKSTNEEDGLFGSSEEGYRNKLLVIVIDGFRWDYIKKFSLRSGQGFPGFKEFMRDGVHTKYMKSVFPAESFPAWQTINTGCYPQNHSVIGNQFVDAMMMSPSSNLYSRHQNSLFFNYEDERTTNYLKWWEKAKPLWATATDQGLRIATLLWGRCDIPWNDVQTTSPDYCESVYQKDDSKTLAINVGKALIYFQRGYDAAFVYEDSLGKAGEEFGPLSKEVEEKLRSLDSTVMTFTDQLRQTRMEDNVNIVIMSDHGLAYGSNPSPADNLPSFQTDSIDITEVYVGKALNNARHKVRMIVGSGAYSMIYPRKPRYTTEIVSTLKRNMRGLVRVYRRHEIPEHLHWKESPQAPPILVLAHPGTVIKRSHGRLQKPGSRQDFSGGYDGFEQPKMGIAGYDPEEPEMRGVFMAKGPDFNVNPGFAHDPIELVDLYTMFCFILGIEPQPNDGLWSRIRGLLKNSSSRLSSTPLCVIIFSYLTSLLMDSFA